MKINVLLLFALLILGGGSFAQTVNITDPDYTPLDCANFNDGAAINFEDNGGSGNYGANRNDTLVLCPDLPNGPKLNITFGINAGQSFDVHASDTLYFFDGNNTSAPLLGTLNSGINPNGGSFASTFDNPSGCLTVVFRSDAANEGAGWGANITCGNPAQPFEIHLEAFVNEGTTNRLNPIDTGYVDICLGDSVLLVAKPLFPNSFEANGYGYSQNMNNVTIDWEFADGTLASNNDSVWFTPTSRSGYYVGVKVTDIFPQSIYSFCKIRVSQHPDFYAAGPVENPICAYTNGTLIGGVTPADTAGVDIPEGAFILGGSVAGLTYLPDGSGQEYTTTITMDDFADTAVFTQSPDLQYVCLTMEHSYLGDLEVWLTCPNGTEVALINSYDPGHVNGGFDGGGTFLGDADDNGNQTPGIGWEYCFSTDNNNFENMGTELDNGNTVPTTISGGDAMNPDGIYYPESSFADFIGCPLNGDWTIHVRDNLSVDDGYIFEWSLLFDPELFPNYETYQNFITDAHWVNEPTIISGLNDTAIVVNPMFPGTYDYVFQVTDDFGCIYDTTAFITVKDTVRLGTDDLFCGTTFDLTLNFGQDGMWTFFNSDGVPTFADSSDVNTTVTFPTNGTYNLIYTDDCAFDDTIVINNQSKPFFGFTEDMIICPGGTESLAVRDSAMYGHMSWNFFPNQAQDTLYSNDLPAGTYNLTLLDSTGLCQSDTTFSISNQAPVNLEPDQSLCDVTSYTFTNNFTSSGIGDWTFLSPFGIPQFSSTTIPNPTVTFTNSGIYSLIYTDSVCPNIADTVILSVGLSPVFDITSDFYDCPNVVEMTTLGSTTDVANFVWDPSMPQLNNVYSTSLPMGTYNSTVTTIYGCEKDTTFTIAGQVKIDVVPQTALCGLDISMTTNPVTAPGTWSQIAGNGTAVFGNVNNINTTITVPSYGYYTFLYSENVCDDSDSVTIGFLKEPTINVEAAELCAEGSLPYEVVATSSLDPSLLTWSTGETGGSILVSESGYYTVTATNGCGSSVDSALIDIRSCVVNFPNIFTPGEDDAINAVYKVLVPTTGLSEFKCQIFNRWGNLVYEYADVFGGWDGKAQNGEDCSPGTYFYKLEGTTFVGDPVEMNGVFQLIRK
ncbi:MAG: gliding motility-associated C-terminal domain-containing protein [Bacteroidota bacterium]